MYVLGMESHCKCGFSRWHTLPVTEIVIAFSYLMYAMQIRKTENVSVFMIGFGGRLKFEGPLCENGTAVSWRIGHADLRYHSYSNYIFVLNFSCLNLLEYKNHSMLWNGIVSLQKQNVILMKTLLLQ